MSGIVKANLTLSGSPDGKSEFLANTADTGIVWDVNTSTAANFYNRVREDRYMVPLFEDLVGHGSGYGLLLEPGTSFILEDNYSRITLRTSAAATQVAWTSETILYKAVLNLGTAALSRALTPNTAGGLAARACLKTAFSNAESVASSPNRIEAVQNLLETVPMSSSSYTCVASMHDAFAKPAPDGSLPKLEVDSEVIDKESSGLGGFLDEALGGGSRPRITGSASKSSSCRVNL